MTRWAALVLAAGAGARFGGGKLLAPWGSGVLLDGALAAAFADRAGEGGRLTIVHAAEHALGLSASLRTGLDAVPPEAEGVFIFLADMPKTPPAMAGRLAQAIGARPAAAPVFEGLRGHPVLLRRALFDRLSALEGDRGAGAVLAGLGEDLALVATEESGVVFDVDAPEDLAGRPPDGG